MSERPGNWGRWGADDERGLLNVITPEGVRAATGLVRRGRVYSLAIPLQADAPIWPTRHKNWHTNTYSNPTGPGPGGADDILTMHTHGTTHIDALSHVFYDGQLFNGHSAAQMTREGTAFNAIAQVPGIVTRGVLLDMACHLRVPHLDLGQHIGGADLAACAEAQGVAVRAGDAVLVRTGWLRVWDADPQRFNAGEPGINLDGAAWLAERDVVAIGVDNSGVEVIPTETGELGVHVELIRNHGMYLLELLELDALAADGVHEFLFVAAPLRISRGVGSPLNPLAIA